MKKILFIIDSLACGGAEKSLVSLLSSLDENKYDLNLWMRYPVGEFVSLVPSYVHIVAQPKYNILEKALFKFGGILYSFMFRWLMIIGRKEKMTETLWKCQGWAMKVPQGSWDVVVAYQQGVPTYLMAEKFHGVRKLAWINVDMIKAGYQLNFNSQFYRKIDRITVVSEALHKMMVQKLPEFSDKYVTVLDIINSDITRKLANEPVKRIKTKQEEIIIVTTGRLVPQKGYDLAVSAASELKKMGLLFKWFFIGEGPERQNIETMKRSLNVDENVVLLGVQTNPFAYMAQADIYVQPSKFEGFGMTVGEAKILGKPIVCTNFEVVKDQISNGRNGLVVDMNGKSIANAIYRLATDKEQRMRLTNELANEQNLTSITEVVKVEKILG